MDKTVVKMASELEMLGFLKTNGTQCRFVSLTIKTPVVKIKVGNPFGQVVKNGNVQGECRLFKVSRKIGIINAKYNESVRRRIAEKLGVDLAAVEYEGGKSAYQHLMTEDNKPLPVLVKASSPHDGVFYLQYFPHKSFENVYVNAQGETVPDALVKPWLHKEYERPDYKPAVIAPKLSNIVQLKASGVVIEMPDFEEAEAILAQ